MKITYLKSGKYSLHPVTGPVIDCKENIEANIDDAAAQKLIQDKWAKEFVPELPPWKKPGWIDTADNAKDILIEYAEKKCNLALNKRYAVRTMIKDIKKAMKKNAR